MAAKSMNPGSKYPRKNYFHYPQRTWINKPIQAAPIWASVDLRDGNQALPQPMSIEEKTTWPSLYWRDGQFKHVEVGFPSASTPDFDFVRDLVTKKQNTGRRHHCSLYTSPS